MTIFYFVRHGEIDSNIRKVYAGWSEEPLTDRGIRQAEKVGELLRDKGIAALYCSPLRRTVQTAGMIGEVIGRVPIADEHFKEMRLGLWEGLSEDEVGRRFPEEWRVWNSRPADLKLDGRETLKELQDRVLEGVRGRRSEDGGRRSGNREETCLTQRRKVAKGFTDYADMKVVVVTHVAIIRVMKLYAEGRDLNEYKKVSVSNGEIFKVDGKLVSC